MSGIKVSLDGKVALVTGASKGIGAAVAQAFATAGAAVMISSRKLDALTNTAEAIGGSTAVFAANAGDPNSAEACVRATLEQFGRIDILVNNAGTSSTGAFESLADETWQADFDLKLFGAIRLIRAVVPRMKDQGGGSIVNVTNIGAKQPAAGSMPTTVTRAAGLAMTKALSKEFAGDRIRVNAVCIGLVRAGQHEKTAAKRGIDVEELYETMGRNIPLGRVGKAEEAANVIAFLASEAAGFVTGSSVNIDGGASAVL